MKPTKYTIHEVVVFLNRGRYGVEELLKNKDQLKEIHLRLILELAAEYIAIGYAGNRGDIQQQQIEN
jgi:hypothetical protein